MTTAYPHCLPCLRAPSWAVVMPCAGEGDAIEGKRMTTYPVFQAQELLEVYWDLWLAPGIDFDIIWIARPEVF